VRISPSDIKFAKGVALVVLVVLAVVGVVAALQFGSL
jgi:hypothetical protein